MGLYSEALTKELAPITNGIAVLPAGSVPALVAPLIRQLPRMLANLPEPAARELVGAIITAGANMRLRITANETGTPRGRVVALLMGALAGLDGGESVVSVAFNVSLGLTAIISEDAELSALAFGEHADTARNMVADMTTYDADTTRAEGPDVRALLHRATEEGVSYFGGRVEPLADVRPDALHTTYGNASELGNDAVVRALEQPAGPDAETLSLPGA